MAESTITAPECVRFSHEGKDTVRRTVNYQQGCLYREKRKSGPSVWVFRFRDGRSHRKVVVGSVDKLRTKAEATKACESLRSTINRDAGSPLNVAELVDHYTEKELNDDGTKAHSTREMYGSYIRCWILPEWGEYALCDVRTVAVEEWLRALPLANASRAKIRNIMHALYNHAMRYEWLDKNPISLVRQSAKRERVPDVLTVGEIAALLTQLREPCKTAVFLAFSTGLRVSELLGLKWEDVHFDTMEIRPSRAIVDQVIGPLKTDASDKPVPMDTALANVLMEWRGKCPFNQDSDFIFGSPEKDGRQPYWPDSLMRKGVRPAAVRAGICKHIGWHSFRRTLATLLQGNGETVKTTQDMLRHATSRLTLELYAQGTMPEKRLAQSRIIQAVGTRIVPTSTVINS
jgi:integrase